MTREEVMKAYETCTPVKNWRLGEAFIVCPEEDGDHTAEIICFDDIKEELIDLWIKNAGEFEEREYRHGCDFVIDYLATDDFEYVDEEKIIGFEKIRDFFINNPKCAELDAYFVDYDDLKDILAD